MVARATTIRTETSGSRRREDRVGAVAQRAEGPVDEAAGRFGGDVEGRTDLAEGAALAVEQPETGLHGVAGPVIETGQQLVDQLGRDAGHHDVLRRLLVVGQQVTEGGVAVVADRLVQRRRRRQEVQLGVVGVERVDVAAGLAQRRAQGGRTVTRDADQAALLVEGAADRLTDPEGRVGRELEATTPVELVDGVLETQVALLDEVAEVHALGEGIAAGDRDHEPQVGADETILGLGATGHRSPQVRAALAVGEALGGRVAVFDDA